TVPLEGWLAYNRGTAHMRAGDIQATAPTVPAAASPPPCSATAASGSTTSAATPSARGPQRALAVEEATLDRDHLWVASPLTEIGVALRGLGRPREAVPPVARALAIRERAETKPDLRGRTRFVLARAPGTRALTGRGRAPPQPRRARSTPRRRARSA